MGQELDIAVDLTAPASPGRYTSIWKMASPSHQMFGQRIWVMIQVTLQYMHPSCFLNKCHDNLIIYNICLYIPKFRLKLL